MGLSQLSIKRPVTTLMVMMICLVFGFVSLTRMPLELLPSINPPVAVVMTTFPGASPQEVNSLVTLPLEAALATTSGLVNMSSTSQENMSMMMLQFNWGTDMSEVRADLQEQLDRIRLPEGAQKPSLVKFDPNMQPIMTLTVADDSDLIGLQAQLEATVQPRLEKLAGVAAVFITGAPQPEIRVLLDQEKLNQYNLTQAQVTQVIQASNLTLPAGTIEYDNKSLNLRVVGKMSQVDELASLIVTQVPDLPQGMAPGAGAGAAAGAGMGATGGAAAQIPMKPIRLSDIAEIIDGYTEQTVINRTDGMPSLRITIQKEGEANTVTVANAIKKELDKIRADYPSLNLRTVMDQGEIITISIKNVATSLLAGGLLAMLVLFIFLRNMRSTLIIGVAIPFSVIVTFVLLYFQKLSLNIMSLGGLALGVGMLVDNAIVVIENIYRRLNELDEDPKTAASKGASEVAGAITTSTLTTVAVFLPVVFVGGVTGELFKELALTVTFSLVASLAVALTVIPMMASRFLKAQALPTAKDPAKRPTVRLYTRMLRWSLGHRAATLGIAFVLLVGSLALVPRIGTEFMPAMDEGAFDVRVTMPIGTSLQVTAAKVDELAELVRREIAVERITTQAGSGGGLQSMMGGGGGGSSSGRISVMLPSGSGPTADAMAKVRPVLESAQSDAELSFSVSSGTMSLGGDSNQMQLTVSGPSLEQVRALTEQVREQVATVDGVTEVSHNLEDSKPEVQVVVDREKAMQVGLTPAQVGMSVANAVRGQSVTRLESGSKSTEVRVVYRPQDRSTTQQLEELTLRSPMGMTVKLGDIAEVKEALGPVAISRQNQKATAQVTGLIEGRDLGSVMGDVLAKVNELHIPDGYEVTSGGAAEMMNEALGDLLIALLMAMLLIYMIMAAQFESLLHPFTIMFSMPLAVVGVLVGLFVSGYALGVTAMMGIVILAGIVVNNAIVLVDFTNQQRAAGLPLVEAIVTAGQARIRPIFMTALTTMLGLLPLALGLGEGAEMQAPMGAAVIGGLLTATLLTLIVVPVIYHLFAGKRSVA